MYCIILGLIFIRLKTIKLKLLLNMISIITPVYNGEKFIESCLQVVIEQNCSDIEHIIVDGGSQDQTVEIVEKYAAQYSHIRWISEKDKGQSDAMNKGIKMAKGSIIGMLNVDDYYEPNVLNRVLEIFKTLPEPTLLVGNCNIWNCHNKLTFINKPGKINLVRLLISGKINQDKKLDFYYSVNPSAYFYHKSLHDQMGYYSVENHYTMDLDFLFKAVQVANVTYVDETWGNYRVIPGTKTYSDKADGNSKDRMSELFDLYIKQASFLEKIQVYLGKLIFRTQYFSAYPERLSEAINRNLNKIFKN